MEGGRNAVICLGTDLNEDACQATTTTSRMNETEVDVVRFDCSFLLSKDFINDIPPSCDIESSNDSSLASNDFFSGMKIRRHSENICSLEMKCRFHVVEG